MRLLINVLNISAVSYYYDEDDMVKVFTSGGEGWTPDDGHHGQGFNEKKRVRCAPRHAWKACDRTRRAWTVINVQGGACGLNPTRTSRAASGKNCTGSRSSSIVRRRAGMVALPGPTNAREDEGWRCREKLYDAAGCALMKIKISGGALALSSRTAWRRLTRQRVGRDEQGLYDDAW
jgi:hypothetical protein